MSLSKHSPLWNKEGGQARSDGIATLEVLSEGIRNGETTLSESLRSSAIPFARRKGMLEFLQDFSNELLSNRSIVSVQMMCFYAQ